MNRLAGACVVELVLCLCSAAWAGQVTICHVPADDPNKAHTISLSEDAVDAHLAHGDLEGPCEQTACELATPGGDYVAGGASNNITTCVVLDAIRQVEQGRIARLGRPYRDHTPALFGRHLRVIPGAPFDFIPGWVTFTAAYVEGEVGQVGTQFDALSHVGHIDTCTDDPADGWTDCSFEWYAGLSNRDLGVEHVRPIFARGILVDVLGYLEATGQFDRLQDWTFELDGEPITITTMRLGTDDASDQDIGAISLEDYYEALDWQGLTEDAIVPGAVVLFRTGWGDLLHAPRCDSGPGSCGSGGPYYGDDHDSGCPGYRVDLAQHLVELGVTEVGADSWAGEWVPQYMNWIDANGASAPWFPIHDLLMRQNGVYNHELLDLNVLAEEQVYVFAYSFNPVRYIGVSGSPGDPIAIW